MTSKLCWVETHDFIRTTLMVILFLTQIGTSIQNRPTREYLKMRMEERIKFQGYPCDVHEITTSDGYELLLYRISYGVNPTKNFECDGEYVNVENRFEEEADISDEDYEEYSTEDDQGNVEDYGDTSTIRTSTPTGSSETSISTTIPETKTLPEYPSTRRTNIQKISKKKKPKRSNRDPQHYGQNLIYSDRTPGKSIVLFLHGMMGSPSNFIHNGKNSTAFYFADRGFDVWILCFRGTDCGQKKLHVKYDKEWDREFWDFTFEHMATIDVPAAIDYILPLTNQTSLHMIGHSGGTIIQIIFLSERPEYASKVKIGSHFGGSVFLGRSDYPFLQFISALGPILKGVHKFFGWHQILPSTLVDMFVGFLVETCFNKEYFHVCEGMNSIIASHKSVLVDRYSSIAVLLNDAQMHRSPKEVFHFMEMMAKGECVKYDYGKKRNLKKYGQEKPPVYNFSRVTNPIILHYSESDHFGNLPDIKRAVKLLPNVVQVYKVPFWRFTHTDYILGRNASKLVYENTCQMMKNYDRGERFEPLTKVDIEETLYW